MRQPYGAGSSPRMQLQTVRRSYRTAEGYERDAAQMRAHGFLRTRQDARGVTWERLVPWGTEPPVPPQVRERGPELAIVLGVFGALLLLMLLLIAVSNAGNYAFDNSPTIVPPTPTATLPPPGRGGPAGAPNVPQPPQGGVVPQPITLPTSNPAFLPPAATPAPLVTPVPTAVPGAPLPTAPPLPPPTARSP